MITVELESMVAPLAGVLLIFTLRVVGVAVGTVRVLFTTRGNEIGSAVLGFLEVLIFVLGVGIVVNNLGNIPNLIGYCAGFSAGTVLGIRIENHLAMGTVALQVVSQQLGRDVADELRNAGYGATLGWGEGMRGTVGIITSVVPRRNIAAVKGLIMGVDRDAFVVVGGTQAVSRGWLRLARNSR